MAGLVSARPERLVRFEQTATEMVRGIRIRSHAMESAVEDYVRSCDATLAVDVGPVLYTESSARAAVGLWCSNLDALATWTGDVGRAFANAGARASYIHPGSQFWDGVVELPDSKVNEQFSGGDPYLGYTDAGERDHTGKPPEPDDPAFQGFLENSGVLLSGVNAAGPKRLVLKHMPGVTRVQAGEFQRWLGKAGVATNFVTGGRSQWYDDHDYAGSQRAQRAAIAGGIVALSGWVGAGLGGVVGVPACAFTGPLAPACAGGFIFGGAIIGAEVGGSLAGKVNDGTGHEPAAHDYRKLGGDVADDTFPGRDDTYGDNAEKAAAEAAKAKASRDPALQRAIEARHPVPRPAPGPPPVPPR